MYEGNTKERKKRKRTDTAAGCRPFTYKSCLEQGSRTGDFDIWDSLEDLFNVHQRKLREIL